MIRPSQPPVPACPARSRRREWGRSRPGARPNGWLRVLLLGLGLGWTTLAPGSPDPSEHPAPPEPAAHSPTPGDSHDTPPPPPDNAHPPEEAPAPENAHPPETAHESEDGPALHDPPPVPAPDDPPPAAPPVETPAEPPAQALPEPSAHPATHSLEEPLAHSAEEAAPPAPAHDTPASAHEAPPAHPDTASHGPTPAASHGPAPGPEPEGHGAPTPEHPAETAAASASLSVRMSEWRSLLELAKRLSGRQNWPAAEDCYRNLLETVSDRELRLDTLRDYGAMLAQNKRWPEAVLTLERFTKEGPHRSQLPQVFLELGRIYREMGAYDLSLRRFYSVLNATLRLADDELEAYRAVSQLAKFEIAETYALQGDFTNARKFFSRIQVLDLPPEDRVRAAFREAQTAFQDREYGRATVLLRSLLADYRGHPLTLEAGYMLCVALRELRRDEESLQETLNFLRLGKTIPNLEQARWAYWQKRVGNQLANHFYNEADYRSALTLYQLLASFSLEPAWHWPVQYQIGLCYERLQQPGKALQIYQSIVSGAESQPQLTAAQADLRDVLEMTRWRLAHLGWGENKQQELRLLAAPPATAAHQDS